MTDHALEVLEFGRVLERIAARASSDVGRERVLALRPSTDAAPAARELARVGAVMRFVDTASGWASPALPDVRPELTQIGVAGSVLDPSGLHRIGRILSASRLLAAEFGRHETGYPELSTLIERLVDEPDLEKAIGRTVDEDGTVLSTASHDLKRIRDRLRGAQARIVRKLESYLASLPDRFVVADGSVTIREGRYVIPLRREGRGEVGGIVHDESQTGATIFVEPPLAIEAMNELRDLEREEGREIRRVLGQMTDRLRPKRHEFDGSFQALADFDSLHARARAAHAWDGEAPELSGAVDAPFDLREARHPLLLEAGDGPVVPYDLSLAPEERCLVVSGPNTGGKSVFLKATGLIAALAQSGVIPPVGAGTRLPVFGSFFADIGDEQSIARNLSTFSAHLANLADIVTSADGRSLVLIDEMGTGTDPMEGAALARAVIDELVGLGARTIVSSHLGELKRLDTEGSGIVNASLQFDAERMEPTYRLAKGRPGRSYGLAIARRLGFPVDVLDRADGYRADGPARMEDVLERLEQRESEVEDLLHRLDLERNRAERLREDVEARERTLEEQERSAEQRAREDARRLLLDARAEVEEAIREVRDRGDEGGVDGGAAAEARRRVEQAADRHRRALDASRGQAGAEDADADVATGDRVRIGSTGAKGSVVEIRDDRGVVEVGAIRFEVPLSDLEVLEGSGRSRGRTPARKAARDDAARSTGAAGRDDATGGAAAPRRGGWTGPTSEGARIEIDLRGLRVDEMELELQRALDAAIIDDLAQLRIIHGKGTGALRQRVGEMLSADRRVVEHRMGGPTEGGAGVTVARLR